jgi:hypothetical protein
VQGPAVEIRWSGWGSQLEIVETIGNELVPEGFSDLAILQQEHSGHTLDVASGKSNPMALQPSN